MKHKKLLCFLLSAALAFGSIPYCGIEAHAAELSENDVGGVGTGSDPVTPSDLETPSQGSEGGETVIGEEVDDEDVNEEVNDEDEEVNDEDEEVNDEDEEVNDEDEEVNDEDEEVNEDEDVNDNDEEVNDEDEDVNDNEDVNDEEDDDNDDVQDSEETAEEPELCTLDLTAEEGQKTVTGLSFYKVKEDGTEENVTGNTVVMAQNEEKIYTVKVDGTEEAVELTVSSSNASVLEAAYDSATKTLTLNSKTVDGFEEIEVTAAYENVSCAIYIHVTDWSDYITLEKDASSDTIDVSESDTIDKTDLNTEVAKLTESTKTTYTDADVSGYFYTLTANSTGWILTKDSNYLSLSAADSVSGNTATALTITKSDAGDTFALSADSKFLGFDSASKCFVNAGAASYFELYIKDAVTGGYVLLTDTSELAANVELMIVAADGNERYILNPADGSAIEIVRTATKVAYAQQYTASQRFEGVAEALADCLFTFTSTTVTDTTGNCGGNTTGCSFYTIESDTKDLYFTLQNGSNFFATSPRAVHVYTYNYGNGNGDDSGNIVFLHDQYDSTSSAYPRKFHLRFSYKGSDGNFNFERFYRPDNLINSSGANQPGVCNIVLFRQATTGEDASGSGIPGYVQIQYSEITSGGKYLIAHEHEGAYYLLYASTEQVNSVYANSAKVLTKEAYTFQTAETTVTGVTVTAVGAGTTSFQINEKTYYVYVREANDAGCTHTSMTQKMTVATCTKTGKVVKKCDSCAYQQVTILPKDSSNHSYRTVAAQAATCTTDGWETYQICDDCGVMQDKDGNSISEIPTIAAGHQFTVQIEAKAATCTVAGNEACMKCANCDTYQTADGKIPTISAIGHDYTDAEELTLYPTIDADGKIYQVCNHENCTEEKILETLPKIVIEVAGDDGETDTDGKGTLGSESNPWKEGSGNLSITLNVPGDAFDEAYIYMDNEDASLTADDYELVDLGVTAPQLVLAGIDLLAIPAADGVRLVLKEGYLKTLSAGTHTLYMQTTYGLLKTTVVIAGESAPAQTPSKKEDSGSSEGAGNSGSSGDAGSTDLTTTTTTSQPVLTQVVTTQNVASQIPNTGDMAYIVSWAMMLTLCGAAYVLLIAKEAGKEN